MRKAIMLILLTFFAAYLLDWLWQLFRLDIIRLTLHWDLPMWLRAWIWGWY